MTTYRPSIRPRAVQALSFFLAGLLLASLGAAQAKLGVIDVERILTDSVSGKAALAELERISGEKRQALEAKKQELESLQARFAESRLTLSEDKLADMQRELEDGTLALRRAQDDAQREVQTKQQEQFARIEREVLPIIQAVGKENGFTLIFNKYQGGLVYADETVDITDMVIERFDQSNAGG